MLDPPALEMDVSSLPSVGRFRMWVSIGSSSTAKAAGWKAKKQTSICSLCAPLSLSRFAPSAAWEGL